MTTQQIIFLKMVKSGTAPRNPKNKTAQALHRMGLINVMPSFGWCLTSKGVEAIDESNA